MASLPYPLCHDCQADIVGMARMPYPPTICNEILTITLKKSNIYYLAIYIILFGHLIYITLPLNIYILLKQVLLSTFHNIAHIVHCPCN